MSVVLFGRLRRFVRRPVGAHRRTAAPRPVPYQEPAAVPTGPPAAVPTGPPAAVPTGPPAAVLPATVLCFRDGSAVALDPRSPAAAGLQTLARRLREPQP